MRHRNRESKIKKKMSVEGMSTEATAGFLRLLGRVDLQEKGHIPLENVSLPDNGMVMEQPQGPDELRELQDRGRGLLSKVVVIKLNGGRSTTMGGEVPKGILKAKNGL
ncbi:MAG: UTP--glucose-1-phosphate uridylyltransferase, partial [Pseudomonadota bacterium]